jgi:hypothetical protein
MVRPKGRSARMWLLLIFAVTPAIWWATFAVTLNFRAAGAVSVAALALASAHRVESCPTCGTTQLQPAPPTGPDSFEQREPPGP